jgi:hypothetical protein
MPLSKAFTSTLGTPAAAANSPAGADRDALNGSSGASRATNRADAQPAPMQKKLSLLPSRSRKYPP